MPTLPPFLKRKSVLIPAALLATYALLGFLVAPRVLKARLPGILGEALKRPATVGDVSLNPFSLEVVVRDFEVTEKDGSPLVAFRMLRVNASFFALLRGRIGFDAIALDGPTIAVTLLKDGSLSFADLLEPGAPPSTPPPDESAKSPLTIAIAELAVTDGAFTFHDLTRADPFTAHLAPLSLALNDFTTETGRGSRYSFKAKLGDAQLEYDGDFSARPLKSSGRLSMKGIRLNAAQPYVASVTQLEVRGGTLGIEGRYAFDATQSPAKLVLEDCGVEVDDLQVNGAGEQQPPLELHQLRAVAPRIDLNAKEAVLSELVLRQATVRARREAGGRIQLVRLASAKTSSKAPAAAAPAPAPTPKAAAGSSDKGWSLRLARVAIEDSAVEWADQSLESPAKLKLDQVKLELTKLAWPAAGPVDASLSFRWQEQGTVNVTGKVTPDPFSADLALDVAGLGLGAIDGYARNAGFAGTLQQATLGAKMKAQVAQGGDRLAVSGDADLQGIAVLDADDRPLLNARAVALKGLDFQSAAASSLTIDQLQLSGFKLKVQRKGNGDLNVEQLVRETPAPRAPPSEKKAESSSARAIALKALVLDDFNVDWLDETTAPAFATSLTRLSGRITNLGRPMQRPVSIKLAGKLDQAPLNVNGTVMPGANALASNMQVTIEGYDLPHVTPYSVRYTAQPINTGKLSLSITGQVAEKKVTAQTKSLIDQLEFGDSVPNPGEKAKSLPLGLATAVLSDREGRIDLELPVFGDMTDPDFEWGGLLWKTLLNVLDKVATAPFAMLAGATNGVDPDVLKLVAFSPGATSAVGDEANKLDTLAALLNNRPRLKLELTPGADGVSDRDALARDALRRSLAIKAARAAGKSFATDGGTPALVPAEYERLVSAAWTAQAGARADGGTAPSFAEEEAELVAKQAVRPEDLAALGRERAAWFQAGLAERGIPVTRVFIVQPSRDKGARAQVDVGLR